MITRDVNAEFLKAELLEEGLKKWFGYNKFRDHQKEIVQKVLENRDVLAILPTGAGKSICYQLPALLQEGTAIVISPLISLMQDQVGALIKNGIPAAYVNSSLPLPDFWDIMRNLDRYKLLYIAPERFSDPNFLEKLKGISLSFFVVDEAHCISQWGHAFRPDYRQLAIVKKTFPDKPLMALTATATPEVEKDIQEQLQLQNPHVEKGSFDRPNLMISATPKEDTQRQIITFLKRHKDQAGIIYAATRKTVDALHEELTDLGYNPGKYHAGMSDTERQEALHNFIHDKSSLMVATVAFGMGINKPDIRFIIHHDMPQSIEQYYQEIGRAGRDGLPADCLMLYSGQDLHLYRYFIKENPDENFRTQMEKKLSAIYSLCLSTRCRRIGLLNYFGERYYGKYCPGCDNCVLGDEKIEGTIIAQKILSCVYRLGESYGINYLIEVLRGSQNQIIKERGHDKLSTFNLMPEFSEHELRYYIDGMIMMGLLASSGGDYPVFKWTENSRKVIRNELKVEFRKQKSSKVEPKRVTSVASPQPYYSEREKPLADKPFDERLLAELKKLRLEIAREESIPPYAVFADRSLQEMAALYPKSEREMIAINGVGRFKLQNYGARFIDLIKSFCLQKR